MFKKMLICLSLLGLAVAAQADGHGQKGKHEISLAGGLPLMMGTSSMDDSYEGEWSAGLTYKYFTSHRSAWGLSYDLHNFEGKSITTGLVTLKAPDFKDHALNIIYHMNFSKFGSFLPYMQVGAGAVQIADVTDASGVADAEIVFGAKAALGFNYMFNHTFGMSLSANYQYVSDKHGNGAGEQHILTPMLGFNFDFGGPAAAAVVAAPAVVKKMVTKAPDADADGVADEYDQCPGTAADMEVNRFGCKKGEALQMNLDVKFASGKSEVNPDYMADIDKLATLMQKHEDTTVVIEGHSDSMGKDTYNKWLSQKRAEAVQDYLVSRYGIAKERLQAMGYGEERPIADNSTRAGRKANRRVVAVFATSGN